VTIERARSAEIEALALAHRDGWPEDLRVMLSRYPREKWESHANLGDMARFWLSRHAMFRELSATIEQVTEQFRAGKLPPLEFARQFVPRLQFILDQLNVHHQIEDFHYFPIFRAADARLSLGFEVLEGDHHHIHGDMSRTAETANALLQALRGDADTLRRCSDGYANASAVLLKGLIRHLDDEEDLIVPLILDRGEEELGVAHHG
jgi:hemerythrin-like domain-containing protein